jgi:hypothetical protein
VALPGTGTGDEPRPDTVKLVSGDVLTGRVVYEDDDCVLVRDHTHDRELHRADVADVQSADRALSDLLDWLDSPRDADALVARAAALDTLGLSGEARLLRLSALLIAPDHAGANAALGNRRQGSAWTWHRGHKWLPVAQLDSPCAWEERWVLDTLHYQVAGNLPLSQLVPAALDLERQRRALVALFRGHVRIEDGEDVLRAELHADKASFPESIGDRPAYYDPAVLTLFVNAADGLRRDVVAHEATHQVLHVGTQRSKSAKGEIPSWLDEGLSEFVRFALRGAPGHATFDFGQVDIAPLAVQAAAPEPIELRRLLTMDAGDFAASTKVELKYSEACSLVAYGLLGDDGARRADFFRFVRLAWDGHASMSDFKACAGGDLDAYEKSWFAWVKAHGKR